VEVSLWTSKQIKFSTIKELEVGQVLEMIATDSGSIPDMQAWARQTQHELLYAEKEDDGKFKFLIKKTH